MGRQISFHGPSRVQTIVAIAFPSQIASGWILCVYSTATGHWWKLVVASVIGYEVCQEHMLHAYWQPEH